MSDFPLDIHMEDHSISLDVVFPDQGEDSGAAVEEETLPTVEEIVPRYPDAKPEFHKVCEVVTGRDLNLQ